MCMSQLDLFTSENKKSGLTFCGLLFQGDLYGVPRLLSAQSTVYLFSHHPVGVSPFHLIFHPDLFGPFNAFSHPMRSGFHSIRIATSSPDDSLDLTPAEQRVQFILLGNPRGPVYVNKVAEMHVQYLHDTTAVCSKLFPVIFGRRWW